MTPIWVEVVNSQIYWTTIVYSFRGFAGSISVRASEYISVVPLRAFNGGSLEYDIVIEFNGIRVILKSDCALNLYQFFKHN